MPRQDSSTVPAAAAMNSSVRNNVRSSITIASAMTDTLSPHVAIVRPAAAPSASSVRNGTSVWRTNGARSRPAISTTQAPPTSAISGEIASQSISGPCTFSAAKTIMA
jgi:hypothetical protein